MKTINCTPTWKEATRLCLFTLEHGNETGKEIATKELLRMAGLLDQLLKGQDNGK